jgi:hypothetical protein
VCSTVSMQAPARGSTFNTKFAQQYASAWDPGYFQQGGRVAAVSTPGAAAWSSDFAQKHRKPVRRKSVKRAAVARKNPVLKAWRAEAKKQGYMKKGAAFKPLPKKGTAGYMKIKKGVEARLGTKKKPSK